MSNQYKQPEPCLGRRGFRTSCDHEGRCYSTIACSTFGYCRERAVQLKGTPSLATMQQWQQEAKQRAEAAQK